MTPLVISGLLFLGLPLFLLYFFKANAGIMFLSACAGLLLLGSLDPAVVTTAGAVVPGEGEAYVRLAVVLMSMVFAALVYRGSVSSAQLAIHSVLAGLLGVTLWLVLPGVTGVSWLLDAVKEDIWQDINEFQTLIIAASLALSFLVVRPAKPHKEKHKKH